MKKKRVFALGFFDGVHLGHQALLRECRSLAERMGCGSAVLTFDTHPDGLVHGKPPVLINSIVDRKRLLRSYGIGAVYTLPFDTETMSMPWQDFFRMLLTEFGAVGIVCGDDFRCGHRGEGTAQQLRIACEAAGIPCVIVPEQQMDDVRISSTHIRELIEAGKMESAVRFLGHGHLLTGQVVPGRKLGHKLGFPTANVLLPEGVVCPRHGVYACYAHVNGKRYLAVTNVGSRPTVQGHQVRTESWILDFEGDLYGEEITLEFHRFLREERKFSSLEELKAAVEINAGECRDYFLKFGKKP